jgi:hypothetical protein
VSDPRADEIDEPGHPAAGTLHVLLRGAHGRAAGPTHITLSFHLDEPLKVGVWRVGVVIRDREQLRKLIASLVKYGDELFGEPS